MSNRHMQTLGRPKAASTQSKAYDGTAAAIDNALDSGVDMIHVICTTAAHIQIGKTPVATTSDMPIKADTDYYFTCHPSDKVSVIQQAAGGTLYVTPIVQ